MSCSSQLPRDIFNETAEIRRLGMDNYFYFLSLNECYKWQAQLAKRTGLAVEAPRLGVTSASASTSSSGLGITRLSSSPAIVALPPAPNGSRAPPAGARGLVGQDPVLGLLSPDAGLSSSLYDGVPEQPAAVHTRSHSQPTASGVHSS